ncbi:M15 family metallopeptidase [Prochlorococcus sp. MIT 1307]|uniref:M15 family metallopeptidase n=1 Tax=Prochlorococcus sp. MIT 1307 TaxID=3096219 RepID=UPI002A75F349|nr:M15 family metallopeptidase [Prochlorococcus sp. MIT 1307]
MARAESARSNNTDDIPLARRSNPIRPSSKGVRFIALASAFLGGSAILLYVSFSSRFIGSAPLLGTQQLPSSDGLLLGHFPYPEVSAQQLVSVYPGLDIHKDTYKALKLMRSAASADGIDLVLLSGYRSHDLQRQIFYGRKSARNQIAIERAKVSAPPGYSEHSTGYAIDLGDAKRRETDLEVEFETTDAFIWLQKNAAKYHFVLSFPRGNAQKVSYEPWHWRFEGTVDALRQFQAANERARTREASN